MSVLSIVATSIVGAAPVRADDREADALFEKGVRLLESRPAKACEAFEESYRLDPRAGTSINIGLCREKTGQLASAWLAYKEALRRVQDPNKKALALERMAALEPKLSYLTISVPDVARSPSITHRGQAVDPGQLGVPIPVDGGRHAVVATAPGFKRWRTTVEVADERDVVVVEVPPLTPKQSAGDEDDDVDGPSEPGTFTVRRKVAVAFAVVGLSAIGGGIGLGLSANRLDDKARALCPDPSMCIAADEANGYTDRARSRALFANIAYGVGGAAIVTAIVLWVTGTPASADARVSVTPYVGDTSGADVTVRF